MLIPDAYLCYHSAVAAVYDSRTGFPTFDVAANRRCPGRGAAPPPVQSARIRQVLMVRFETLSRKSEGFLRSEMGGKRPPAETKSDPAEGPKSAGSSVSFRYTFPKMRRVGATDRTRRNELFRRATLGTETVLSECRFTRNKPRGALRGRGAETCSAGL